MADLRAIIEEALNELAAHVPQMEEHFYLPGDAPLVANHIATAIEAAGTTAQPADTDVMQVDAVITKPNVTANVKISTSLTDALRVLFTDSGKPQQ